MPSSAEVAVAQFEISPCKVTYNSVEMGATLDNVTVTFEYTKAEAKADQWGTTVADRFNSGFSCTVETALAQVREKDKIVEAFPNVRDTTVSGDRVLDFMNRIGYRDKDNFAELVLHRLTDATATEDNDLVFFKAVPNEASSLVFGPEEQMKLAITWNIYPDTTEGYDFVRFFRIGKSSVVVP